MKSTNKKIGKQIVFDIETNHYLNDWTFEGDEPELRTMAYQNISTDKVHSFCVPQLLKDAETLIGHNIIKYDLPFLKRFYHWEPAPNVKIIDTYVLATLLFPEYENGLKAWGDRLGITKPGIEDFSSASTEEIQHRCEQDVRICTKLYRHLLAYCRSNDIDLKLPYKIESKVSELMHNQEEHGVWFDSDLAEQHLETLEARMETIRQEIEPQLPERLIPESQLKYPPQKKFKKDGTPSALAIKYFGDALRDTGIGWYVGDKPLHLATSPVSTTAPMTLDNTKGIKGYLMEQGWNPTFWNVNKSGEQTSPKIALQGTICPNLLDLGEEVPNIRRIVEYNSYKHRRNMIKSATNDTTGFLNHPRLKLDHRLPAGVIANGAATGRMMHKVVANIPRVNSVFGREMRDLFAAPEGKVLVGWDAASLEDRCKAHYVYPYDPEYAERLLDPTYNVHDINTALWFNVSPDDENWSKKRSLAKNGQFALVYGCTAPKLAETLKVSREKGQQMYDAWWELNSPLLLLKKDLEHQLKVKGYIRAIDGRQIKVKHPYKAVNYLCQSMGAILMKVAMCYWQRMVDQQQIPVNQVIHYHDEVVAETILEYGELSGELGVQSIIKAGRYFKTNVPMNGEYKVGRTWGDVH